MALLPNDAPFLDGRHQAEFLIQVFVLQLLVGRQLGEVCNMG